MRWGVFWIGGYDIMSNSEETTKREIIRYNDIPHKYPQSIFNKKGYIIRTQKNFVKVSLISLSMLSNETFNPNEIKILFSMLKYIRLDKICSGVLTENGIPINKNRLMELMRDPVKNTLPNINTFDANIERLEDKELIKRVRYHNGIIYYVNPFVFMNGEQIEPYTFALFYQSKWNVYGD